MLSDWVLTDNHFYSGYCRTGADGRNYSEESFSFFVSGTGCVPAVDYNELLYSRCGNLVIQKDFDLLTGVVYAFSTALGFGLALVLFAGLREQMTLVKIPKGMQGLRLL